MIDTSPLQQYLLQRIEGSFPVSTYVDHTVSACSVWIAGLCRSGVKTLHNFAYGASKADVSKKMSKKWNLVQSLMDSGVTVRGFHIDADGPVLAPTVALVADLFHAAHNTSVAFPSASKKDDNSSNNHALVLVSGSAAFAPALARLAQGGQDVFVACTAKDFARLHAVLPPTVRNHVLPLYMDDAFPELLRPVEHYTSDEAAWVTVAYRLREAVAAAAKGGAAEVSSSELSAPLRASGVLPFMAARSMGPRQLFSAFPSLFSVHRGPNGSFSVSAQTSPPPLDQALQGVQPSESQREPKHVHSITSDAPEEADEGSQAAIDDAMAAVAASSSSAQSTEERAAAAAAAGTASVGDSVSFEEIDMELLLASAAEQGFIENSKANKKNLYTLLVKCDAPAKSRMTKPQLQECLAQNLELVAQKLTQ